MTEALAQQGAIQGGTYRPLDFDNYAQRQFHGETFVGNQFREDRPTPAELMPAPGVDLGKWAAVGRGVLDDAASVAPEPAREIPLELQRLEDEIAALDKALTALRERMEGPLLRAENVINGPAQTPPEPACSCGLAESIRLKRHVIRMLAVRVRDITSRLAV